MSNMNNWLGFSLSPQELQEQAGQTFNASDEISTNDSSCFHLPSDSSIIPSLNRPFGILEAFNRNTNHSQDWNMNINPFSCSSGQNMEDESRPKLENFMGVHLQEQQKSSNYEVSGNENSYNNSMYQESEATSHSHSHSHSHSNNNNNSTSIGLSMITNWLRNNPSPAESKEAAPPAAQTLSLSMSTGSHSSSPLPSDTKIGSAAAAVVAVDTATATATAIESVPRKSIDTFGQRTSIYRGVTRHRWTGRYEAHLWDNSCRREGQTRKGRQVYLGGYDKEDKAARAYDLAALKYWGTTTTTNFPMSNYEKEIEEMKHMTRQEYVASLRRKSSGFSRGASMYRGVTRHHQHGRWQARIGRVAGNKDLYLGTFSTEEEAAEAYDIAAIKFRGLNAVTNFEINRYDVKSILESSSLPIGGAAKRLKDAEKAEMALRANEASSLNLHLTDHHHHHHHQAAAAWPTIAFQPSHHGQSPLTANPYSSHQRLWCKQEQDYPHGFMQQHHPNYNSAALHNIMGLDSSNPNYGSTSAMNMNMNMNMMMGTVIVQDGGHGFLQEQQEGNKNIEYEAEAMFGSSADARNFYSSNKSNIIGTNINGGLLYDQGSTSSANWIPTAVPARTGNNMAAFTVWNDT